MTQELKTQQELADLISEVLTPSRFGYRIYYTRILPLLKGRGKNTNPFYNRVVEHSTIINPRVGCDWDAIVDSLTEKYNPQWFSQSHGQYEKQQPSRYTYYNRFFNRLISDPDQFYLKYNLYQNSLTTRELWVEDSDGFHPASPEELQQIALWLPAKNNKPDERQTLRGIPPEQQLKFKSCRVEGIREIWKGSELLYKNNFGDIFAATA